MYIPPYYLTGLSDVSISNAMTGHLLVYDGSTNKWKNQSSLNDALFVISSANGGKIQFNLTNVTGGVTRVLMVPDTNLIIVGIDTAQTLTNKTIDSVTNTITCDKLQSSTGTIIINTHTPATGQVLMATSTSNAIWALLPISSRLY